MPIGISIGEKIDLDIKSERIKNDAPKIELNGITYLLFAPTINLMICGTTNPTKPIIPQSETETAAKKEARPIKINLFFSTSIPRDFASSSDNSKIFNLSDKKIAKIIPKTALKKAINKTV